jgi:hypothetical protein
MIDGIEAHYQTIADSIVEVIGEPWTRAWIDAIFFSESIEFTGGYVGEDARPRSFGPKRPARNAIREIRELFRRAGKPLWGRTHFELHSDGKFDMTWSYDDCDEDGNARFDEVAERKRHQALIDSLG